MRILARHLIALAIAAFVAEPALAAPKPRPRITRPDWAQKPTGDQMADFYPKKAQEERVSGKAWMTCAVTAQGVLRDCVIDLETPRGWGFGEAALGLASFFLMKPKTVDGEPVDGGEVTVPINFEYPEERLGDGAMVMTRVGTTGSQNAAGQLYPCPDGYGQCYGHTVTWAVQPDARQTRRMIAKGAPKAGATFAACTTGVDGALLDCIFAGDQSDAAMAVIRPTLANLRAPETADDGLPTATTTIVVPFIWELIDAELAAAASKRR